VPEDSRGDVYRDPPDVAVQQFALAGVDTYRKRRSGASPRSPTASTLDREQPPLARHTPEGVLAASRKAET
jgi:hypothetical protein